ncbi:MAG: AgmX/PglI C-terminal domain-containing protein [Kofleriaceae bacterium]|nr:AgmX/PglI C-terminal domain-containing protein [Kofleriaceae bacterium]
MTDSKHWYCLTFAFLALLMPTSALAETKIEVVGGGQVNELAHKLEIQWTRERIDVVETITLSNAKRGNAEALYSFDLPAQAGISDFSIRDYSGNSTVKGVVGEGASINLIKSGTKSSKPDTGLLRMIASEGSGRGDTSRYELRVFPVPRKSSSVVTIRWQAPVQFVSGNYSVRLPNRGDSPVLSRSEVIINSRTKGDFFAAGAKLTGGQKSGNAVRHRFFAPVGDLVIQNSATLTGKARAEVALYPLTATTGIAAIRVIVPEGAQSLTPKFERVLLLIDASKSMGKAGREAAAKLVDGMLISLGANIKVEAITYNRKSNRVLGSWQRASRGTRNTIAQSIRRTPLRNGSNLSQALLLGQASLGSSLKKRDRTLVVIVTDGLLPTMTSYTELETSLGFDHLNESRVLTAILVRQNAPLPDWAGSPLATLAQKGRGRVTAIRHDEAAKRGQEVLSELSQPTPLEAIEVELDRGVFVGDHVRGIVASGQSAAAFGFYKGGAPKRVWVKGMRAGTQVQIAAKILPRKLSSELARVVLATTSADAFPATKEDETRKQFRAAARQLSVVTQVSALVALNKKDGFATDRLALANKWGPEFYRRMPTPAERADGHFASFSYVAKDSPAGRSSIAPAGELPKSLVSRLIRAHVIAPVRNCYEGRLGREPNLAGSLSMHIEIVRGEVSDVKLIGMSHSLRPLTDCILDAAYAVPFPKPAVGANADTIYIVNYPLRFRRIDRDVVSGTEGGSNPDDSDPLFGLPE